MIAGFAAGDEAAVVFYSNGRSMDGLPTSDKQWRLSCQAHFGVPRKTDLARLAKHHGSVSGVVPVTRMTRLVQDLPKQHLVAGLSDIPADGSGTVWFEFRGSSQQGRRSRIWLKVQAGITLVCQRCMGNMLFVVDEAVEFELFADEAKANAVQLEDETDPDAPEPLVTDGPMDLMELIEDQLILAVPYVPKHETCEPAQMSAGEPIEIVKRESPFKVLHGLKRDSNE